MLLVLWYISTTRIVYIAVSSVFARPLKAILIEAHLLYCACVDDYLLTIYNTLDSLALYDRQV